MSGKMTAAMVLADFRLDDVRPQSKALIRARVESLGLYAANYHNSYETLSSILHERTKALRDAEAQVATMREALATHGMIFTTVQCTCQPPTENPTR